MSVPDAIAEHWQARAETAEALVADLKAEIARLEELLVKREVERWEQR